MIDAPINESGEKSFDRANPETDFVIPKDKESDHMGIHPQKESGLYWAVVCFHGGRVRNGLLGEIGRVSEKVCVPWRGDIRFTNKQNLVITHIPEENLPALKAELDLLGVDYAQSNFRQGCVSCTGIEFCNLAVAETKNRMIELVGQLEARSGWYKDKIRVHFSGCPSSCGQRQIAAIGFRGGIL